MVNAVGDAGPFGVGLLHLIVTQNRDKNFTFGRSRARVETIVPLTASRFQISLIRRKWCIADLMVKVMR